MKKMNQSLRPLILLIAVLFALSSTVVMAECFNDLWEWSYVEKDSSKIPTAYQSHTPAGVPPKHYLGLSLKSDGSAVTGFAYAVSNFGSRLEEDVKIVGSAVTPTFAQVKLKSNRGGTLEASLTCEGGKMFWEVNRSRGDHAFPGKAILSRK